MRKLVFAIGLGLLSVLLAVTLFRVALPGAEAATLFGDDFEDGNANGWVIAGGAWSVVNDGSNVYAQSAASGRARASAGSSAWTDYAVTARIKPVSLSGSNYVALGARYQSSANFYFLDLRADRVEIRSFVGNQSTVLSSTSYAVSPGTWYTVTFEVNGSTLKGYINGTQLLTATDSTFSSGAVALSTYNATAEFDDVIVTDFVPAKQTLVVTKTGTGSGSVTSIPAGIACGATCTAEFNSDAVVTLTAAADTGSTFVGWTGACAGSGSCVVTMDATKNVAAMFSSDAQPMLLVNKVGDSGDLVQSDPAGIDCGATCAAGFAPNTVVTLTATAGAFSTFVGWSGACASVPCVVTMDTVKQVTAMFTPVTHLLAVTRAGAGAGTVSSAPSGIACGATCAASFSHGTVVTLTATPDAGSKFARWDGACEGSGLCAVTMEAAKSLTATFEPFAGTPYDTCTGYATLGAGTTGGAGGMVVTVTTFSELADYAGRVGAYIIKIVAPINGTSNVWVNSNKTIIGIGSGELIGVGLDMKKKDTFVTSNVIVRDLKISKVVAPNDNIHLEGPNVHHIWIDHCDLLADTTHGKDYYDGLLDISHAVDYVTVSWTKFHDTWKTSLIGNSDNTAAEDTGHFLVTYHHNYFYNANSRMPSNRFGTLHSYNNYFSNLNHEPAFDANTGISSRMGACSRIENNYFDGVDTPILTDQSVADGGTYGYVQLIDNTFVNYVSYAATPTCVLNPPYAYLGTLHSTDHVTSVVTQYAGLGKLADPLQQTCVFSPLPPVSYTLSVSTTGGNGSGSVTSIPA